jgi:outer membrane lipoprotein-sorting protein
MSSRSISRCVVAAVTALLIAGSSAGAQKRTAPTGKVSPRDVLIRVLLAEEMVPFSARRTVVLSNGGDAQATVTDELNYGHSRSRITYALPAKERGTTIIRDGKRRWTTDHSSRTVVESAIVHGPISHKQAIKVADQVGRSYALTLDKEAPVVSGRKAYVLRLNPKWKDRQRRIWWVDRATGLVLRREQYGIDGALEQTTAFSNLQMNIRASKSAVTPRIPAGYRILHRPTDNVLLEIAAARRALQEFGDFPATLGAGFEFQSASLVDADGTRSVHVQYSDGLAGISLFKIPTRMNFTGATDHNTRLVAVGSTKGRLMSAVAPYRVLAWEIAGATYNLVSDISDETMIRMAAAVHF